MTARAAVQVDELLARAKDRVGGRYAGGLDADQWLTVQVGAGLAPTRRAVELGGALDEVQRDTGRGR